jgi:CheY-like chemotaxis protein
MKPPPRVLLVEDNPITRKLVRFVLQDEHFELSEAIDGRTALALAEQRPPDLILQDLLLPDMDGFELAERLRQIASLRGVPILAFSGLLSHFDERRIAASGFTDFVTKPIEPSQLLRIIRAHLPSAEGPRVSFGDNRRIVLADDDEVQRKLSVFKLRRLGFDVVDTADGRLALEAARAMRPAAIVTDAMMPGLDGFGLCAAVRQDADLKGVPIVLVTSTYVDDADRELGRLAGANAFVIRTPDLREMISALESILVPSDAPPLQVQVQPPEFERERASRTMVQLERQAAAAASARQQCAMLSAELAVLNAISEAITQDKDIDVVLRDILAACCDAGGVSIGALYLLGADGAFRTLLVGSHAGWESGTAEPFLEGGTQLRGFIDKRTATLISESGRADAEARAWLERSGLRSALIVPLQHKDRSLGAMVMMSELVDLGLDNRLMFAQAVGHQVSVALALTQAFEDNAAATRKAREQTTLLRSVFSSITDPIVVVDNTGRASAWNPAAQAVLATGAGPAVPPVLSEGWSEKAGLFRADKVTPMPLAEQPLGRALRGESVEGIDIFLRNSHRPEGAWLSVSARPLLDEQGAVHGAVSVSRDVTVERLAHEQLLISDRMASIGMLAASVGHEINNPLSAVMANLEMITAELPDLIEAFGAERLGDLPDEIRETYEAAQRVRRIVSDLKVFSGADNDVVAPVDVESVLESAIRMGWNQVRHRARLVKHYAKVPLASGMESRLGQVFLNLIVNAAQAIPEGHADEHEIRLTTRTDGQGRVVIDVEDTGSGIAPHVMSQLFAPFVTTKPVGIGTGLGLSICHRLVSAMGGSIWAESTVGRGTTFHVALPLALPADLAPVAARPPIETPAASGASILVVDDEEIIGMILRRALKSHDVTVTTSATDALARIEAGQVFDLILCDLMMPVMTGMEFHAILSERYPGQAAAVMFLTGGAFSKETAAFLHSVGNRHLEKPFDLQKLKHEIATQLAERARPAPSGDA